MADELLPVLRDARIGPDAAAEYGDRFRYLRTYNARPRSQVVNNFGVMFADELDGLDVSNPNWAGPFESRFGWHLVLLSGRTDPRLPPLEEIRDKVLYDYRYDVMSAAVRDAEDELLEQYEVVVEVP